MYRIMNAFTLIGYYDKSPGFVTQYLQKIESFSFPAHLAITFNSPAQHSCFVCKI